MNATILNRDFQHPADGWYQIEAKGRHPNRAAGVVQVIDEEAASSIVNRFNEDAEAGTLRHGRELLIDHEHFSDQADKETIAYGWLTRLQNRGDGIYGQIRWSATGQRAVDGGDYRFFSTEYAPEELKALNSEGGKAGRLKEMRPMRLAGLSLTNMNNNRGQKPITNRGGQHPTSNIQHPTSNGEQLRHDLGAGAVSQTQQTKEIERMKTVATKLGLAADASEESVLAEVSKIMNRAVDLGGRVEPLQARVVELETENANLLSEQIDADFASSGIKDEKIINRHKPILSDPKHFKNREERVEFMKDLAPKGAGSETGAPSLQRKLHNRDAKGPGEAIEDEAARSRRAEAAVQDYKIKNRCSYGDARQVVRRLSPELFEVKS